MPLASQAAHALASGPADVAVKFHSPEVHVAEDASKAERREQMAAQKQAAATSAQRGVIALLEAHGASFKSFWINNVVIVEGASLALAQEIAARPEVQSVELTNESMHIMHG